ncbi:MAG: tRNA 2-thiouridine(34) synthase MnmA [Acidocella sp.]|nr:tRNA 2-thiouridine(34) synthase MnmA [Acidocella sp.]
MKIVVAMSGGVDSSVVAGLMHEAGHEVIGVTLQLYDHGAAVGRKGACCAGQDIHDAKRVADKLGFAHYVVDAEARFRASVMAEFADSYASGQTPVPCIACNQHLKFGDLLDMARDLGADALATGHYVRRVDGPDGAELHQAVDSSRDQSWFLFATSRAQLEFCRFPLGDFASKAQVRDIAERMGLAVAAKPDSQDICFVPNGSYADIVGKFRPDALVAGEIVDEAGSRLGIHQGIGRYTVGQAKRLGIPADAKGEALVVRKIEPGTRRIVVGPRAAASRVVQLRDVNWLIDVPFGELRAQVKLRAREAPQGSMITVHAAGTELLLDTPALAAPGQAAVFYDGSRILGGGFISA